MSEIQLSKLAKCAGCGAKVGAGTLAKLLQDLKTHTDPNLLVGFDHSDDASVYRLSDELALVQTVDFFPPMVDDPYVFGQIAATNALSDVYAMGGEPKLAQNVFITPKNLGDDRVREILRGGYDKVYEAGAIITGGHSIHGEEPVYGLAVTGFVRSDRMLTNCGAQVGDALFLTKPLGIGIAMTARKAGMLPSDAEAVRWMTTLNRSARDVMMRYHAHACTDVTGFSLLGHGLELAQGSGVSLVLETKNVPLLEGTLDFAQMGLNPEGMYRNRSFAQHETDVGTLPMPLLDALFDPQTSGGLLIAMSEADADAFEAELCTIIPQARRIGRVIEKDAKSILLR